MEITEETKQTIHNIFMEAGRKCGDSLTDFFPPVPVVAEDPAPHEVCPMGIPDPAVPVICEAVMTFVAELIQSYIDAGSEREATMENEVLFQALEGEIGGWADDHTKYEKEEED